VDKIVFGLSVALIGMLVVFAGLVLLIGCIKLISMASGERKTKKADAVETPEGSPVAVTNVAVDDTVRQTLEPEVLIAITTALLAMYGNEQKLRVRHVRRIHNAPAWNTAGREDQVYSRM